MVRGPGSPFARLRRVRRTLDRIILGEIARRRRAGEAGEDILGLLIEAEDGEGMRFTDEQVRDQVLTLLFAGHDTTTSTVAFLFYELARNPEWAERLAAERDSVVGDGTPDAAQLFGELPELGMAVDETLRLYPPAWIGPRRAAEDFEFGGYPVPAGLPVNYSSWASHRLPDVFADPHSFRPERFAPAGAREAPQGRLRPVRRRPEDLHRDALRRARDPRDRGRDPAQLPPRAGARLADADPPDADPLAARRPADAGPGGLTWAGLPTAC